LEEGEKSSTEYRQLAHTNKDAAAFNEKVLMKRMVYKNKNELEC
jgi:hypothetical protein